MDQKIQIKYNAIVIFFYSLCAVANAWLAFASVQYSALYASVVAFIVYATVPVGLIYILTKGRVNTENVRLLILPVLYWLFLILHTYGGYSGDWIVSLVAVSGFLLMNRDIKSAIFRGFYWIVQVNNIISILMYLCYILNFNIGFSNVPFYTEEASLAGFYYIKWGIFAIASNGLNLRLCGIFNEAGALGTVCALLFVATFRNNKLWEKVLLIVTTFLTFSLAGYLLIFLYLSAYLLRKNKKNIIWLVIIVGIFLAIPNINWGNDSLNLIASRFAITDGGLAGDNRTTAVFDARYDEFIKSGQAWLGHGAGYRLADATSTYKSYIVEFGFVGFVLLMIAWVSQSLRMAKKDKDCLLLIIIFMISLYQRPLAITSLFGYVALFGGMAFIQECREKIT